MRITNVEAVACLVVGVNLVPRVIALLYKVIKHIIISKDVRVGLGL